MKIVIAGGSGFIGSHLNRYLLGHGHETAILTRRPKKKGEFHWDPNARQIVKRAFENAQAVVNLCGESIMGRWTQKKLQRIRESRFKATQFLCQILAGLDAPPRLYIGASAVGYYGDRGSEILTETSHSGESILSEICRIWEGIAEPLATHRICVAFARFGIVFGPNGGALKQMAKPFRFGLGGTLGSGRQIMSWIAIDDLCRGVEHLILHEGLSGPFNFTAPHPVTNRMLTQALVKQFHKPALLRVPESLLYLLFKSGAEIFLSSANVIPERLLKSGFQFHFPEIEKALKKYLRINASGVSDSNYDNDHSI